VVYLPASDAAAAQEALLQQRVDLAWLNGLGWLQAQHRAPGHLLALARPADDNQNRWVLLTTEAGVHRLSDLVGRDLSFGAKSSVSGHLAPRAALMQLGLAPEKDLRRLAFSGSAEATLAHLQSGKVTNGVLSLAAWDRWLAERRQDPGRLRQVFVSAPVADGLWAAAAHLAPALREALQAALLALDPQVVAQREVLTAQRSRYFVAAQAGAWRGLSAAAQAAGLL
jgi:phosphonate transport system substrate-binding protein